MDGAVLIMLKLSALYKAIFFCMLVILSGMWYWPVTQELDSEYSVKILGAFFDNLLFFMMLMVVFYRVFNRGFYELVDYRLFLLLFLLILSAAFSVDKVVAIKSLVRIFLVSLFVLIVVKDFKIYEFVNIIQWFFVGAVLINFISLLVLPNVTFMDGLHQGAARGLLNHKNAFGFFMVVALIFIFSVEKVMFIHYLSSLLAMVMVVMSNSSTSFILLFLVLLLFVFVRLSKKINKNILASVLIFMLAVFSTFFATLLEEVLSYFGKDSDFSNRTLLWEYYLNTGFEKVWFGLGTYFWHQGFWDDFNVYTGIENNYSPHNSYISTFVSYGLLVFLVYYISYFKSLMNFVFGNYSNSMAGFYICIPVFVVRGIMESGLALSVSLYFLLILFVWCNEMKSVKVKF
jgi:hypothetical protein